MVREIKIENDVRSLAHVNLGIESIKLNLAGNRGWPDVMFMYDGQVFFIEFKRPHEKPSDLQEYRINWLKDNGFAAMWTDNVYEAMEALRKWKSWILGSDLPMSQSRPTTWTPCTS